MTAQTPACDDSSAHPAGGRGSSPWWYLVWFGMLGFQPAFDPTAGTVDWAVTAAIAAAGIWLWWLGETRPHRRLAATVALAVIGAATSLLNAGASVLFVYAAGIALTVDHAADVPVSPAAEAALALAVREAVTNVVRHAGARHCTIGIARSAGHVVLTVTDDGHGGRAPDGAGLAGMRERITTVGGTVARDTGPGTTVTVTVPAPAGAA